MLFHNKFSPIFIVMSQKYMKNSSETKGSRETSY